jgi:hypothetical protein
MTALFFFANPNDMALIPSYSMGMISLGLSSGATNTASSLAKRVGNEGP